MSRPFFKWALVFMDGEDGGIEVIGPYDEEADAILLLNKILEGDEEGLYDPEKAYIARCWKEACDGMVGADMRDAEAA